MKVLITGGAGFIGSHLAEIMLQRKIADEVVILDNFSSGKKDNIIHFGEDNLKIIKGDILDFDAVRKSMQGIDVVFHEAAVVGVVRAYKDPLKTHNVNIQGTLNALEAARINDVRRFVFASSSEIYGQTNLIPTKETHELKPISPYGVSKLTGEVYCRAYLRTYGLKTSIIRYFNVYGSRQDKMAHSWVVPNFALRVFKKKPPLIHGDGKQTRDFTYVTDAVNGTILVAKHRRAIGEVFNLGTGRETSIEKLALKFIKIAGEKLNPIHIKARELEISRRCADITKAKKILGYRPKVTLEDGIRRVLKYYST